MLSLDRLSTRIVPRRNNMQTNKLAISLCLALLAILFCCAWSESLNHMKCDLYQTVQPSPTNSCGPPPPNGLCVGACTPRITYDRVCGVCTLAYWSQCDATNNFPIVETSDYFSCEPHEFENPFGGGVVWWCECDLTSNPARSTSQTKLCNCN